MKKAGCVHLVGAGCGDADLITLRGWNLLRACDVVIYDDLIAPELLEALPDQVEKRYMGKRSSCHSAPQAEICAALVDEARKGRRVVRLKGGDPFLFGRGGEEILALQAAGIPCEEVPGIPSAIAIPAEAGIPVTHRGVSRSVHIVTAHTADTADGLPEHLEALARTSGTLVFLMGLAQLPRIAQRLLGAGMGPQTPAAVLSGGNAPHPAEVRGTLADIVQRVQEAGVLPPAVIVVGAVAALHLTESEARPLSGRTIALTGTTAVTDKLRPALRALGAQVFAAERAKVRVLPLPSLPPVLNSGKPCWLVFTSANGVEVFFSHLCRWGVDLRRLHTCRFAVIGAATKAALWAHGIQADLCPDTYTSEALAGCLTAQVPLDAEILLLRSRQGNPALFQALARHFSVQDIPLYDLESAPVYTRDAERRLETADYLVFSSSSGVQRFWDRFGQVPRGVVCVCIGSVTQSALMKRYQGPVLLAPEISAEGVVQAILKRESMSEISAEGETLSRGTAHETRPVRL